MGEALLPRHAPSHHRGRAPALFSRIAGFVASRTNARRGSPQRKPARAGAPVGTGPARAHGLSFVHEEENVLRSQTFDKGLKNRREVLGAEYVDNAIAAADDFSRPLQELVTEYCWGAVWDRPGLDRKTRSIINLAMLTALNRPHELKLHIKGALNNGLSKAEISEVLLQTAIYCGVPAAVDSFRSAREVFAQLEPVKT
ncbi:MAG: carboxymuconolactone decarboxylase family protein [Hyphomicrobiales bacterium]|nr:carboxymuconolactone decarboxylase family protein [Hyphomicrobiales bacterium]MBV9751924.1 carboxymuconolactone decarboxylase family protein [Hyphomicrobiales bacterium]